MHKIDKTIKEQNKQFIIENIKNSKYTILFILAIVLALSWSIYRNTDTATEETIMHGELIGIHQVQEIDGAATTKLSIKLDNGKNVMVTAPNNLAIKNNSKVIINMVKSKQGRTYYNFIRYKELR